jgi:hypothetical protein
MENREENRTGDTAAMGKKDKGVVVETKGVKIERI